MKSILTTFIATLMASALLAQEDSTFNYFSATLEELLDMSVVTASKSNERVSEAPSNILIITKEVIRARGYNSLADLLESVPGIEIQRKSNVETHHAYTLRGITGVEKLIVMQDGVRISSRSGTPHQLDYNYSIANAERVEIILGPTSALYGADAMSGTVNIISKPNVNEPFFNVEGRYGSFDTEEILVSGGFGNEDWSYQINAGKYDSDEPDFSKYYPEEFDWYINQYQDSGFVGVPFDTTGQIKTTPRPYATPTEAFHLVNRLQYKEFTFGHSLNFQSTNSSVSNDPAYAIYDEEAKRNYLLSTTFLEHHLEKGNMNLTSRLSYQYLELTPSSKFVNFHSNYMDAYKFERDHSWKLEEQFNYKSNDSSNLAIGTTIEHFVAVPNTSDLPYEYDKSIDPQDQNIPYLGTDITDSLGNDLSIPQDIYELIYHNIGWYAQYKKPWAEWIHTTIGSRVDWNSRYGLSFNPRIGVVICPFERFNVKYLLGSAYIAPSPFKSYKHFGSFVPNATQSGFTSNFWHLNNPDLMPERMLTNELNISWLASDRLKIKTTVFHNALTDLISPEITFNEEFKDVPIDVVERNINKGSGYTYGGSIGIQSRVSIRNNGSIAPYANYFYVDGKVADQALQYTAKHTLKFGVDYSSSKFTWTAEGLYRGSSLAVINGTEHYNDPFLRLNSHLWYSLFQNQTYNLRMSVSAKNILNQRYYNVPNESQLVTMVNTPQDPIRIMAGIRLGL